jgi:hypothetical protein
MPLFDALSPLTFGGLTFRPVEEGRVIEDPVSGETMVVSRNQAVKRGSTVFCTQADLDALMADTRIRKLEPPPVWPRTSLTQPPRTK